MKNSSWIFISLIFFIIVASSSWVALEQIKSDSLQNVKNSLQTVTNTTHEALHIWIRQRKNDLILLSQNQSVQAYTQQLLRMHKEQKPIQDSAPLMALRKLMVEKMKLNGDVGFFIIAPDKINIASLRDNNLNEENVIFKNRPTFLKRIFFGETLFIPPIHSEVALLSASGEYKKRIATTFIASPVLSENNEVIAVITLRLDPSEDFTRVSQLGRIGESGETYAFDDQGLLITNSRFDHQLQRIGLIETRDRAMLSIRITDPGGNMLMGFEPKMKNKDLPLTLMAKSALAGNSGANITGYRDYRGVLVFGSWIWDKDLGFGLTTEIDVEEALLPYYKIRSVLILIILVILVLTVISFFLWHLMQVSVKKAHRKAFAQLEQIVVERTKELNELSYKDGLTGVANRRMFDSALAKEWQRGQRSQQPLAIIMFDVDYFKLYNDHYGHLQGDICLKEIAQVLAKQSQRSSDICARYGGEEFVFLLPNTNLAQAKLLAEKCRLEVLGLNLAHEITAVENLTTVSISLGVSAIIPTATSSAETLIKQADDKLYTAKKNGRNRVE